ncbi:MAG: F0F1 ATP synthase subunit epsilon [Gemmatimonadota bacterium]
MLPEAIHLEIVTPERRIAADLVDEVMLPGLLGYLGVLPGHAPLLTTLGIGQLVYRKKNVRHYLSISWGFAEILPNRVSVLAEIAERAEEIDQVRATTARDRALGRLRGGDGGTVTDFDRARAKLEKALSRLEVARHSGPDEPA